MEAQEAQVKIDELLTIKFEDPAEIKKEPVDPDSETAFQIKQESYEFPIIQIKNEFKGLKGDLETTTVLISYKDLIERGYRNRKLKHRKGIVHLPHKAIDPKTFFKKFLFVWARQIAQVPLDSSVVLDPEEYDILMKATYNFRTDWKKINFQWMLLLRGIEVPGTAKTDKWFRKYKFTFGHSNSEKPK